MIFIRAAIIGLTITLLIIPLLMMVGLWENPVVVGVAGALVGVLASLVTIGMEG